MFSSKEYISQVYNTRKETELNLFKEKKNFLISKIGSINKISHQNYHTLLTDTFNHPDNYLNEGISNVVIIGKKSKKQYFSSTMKRAEMKYSVNKNQNLFANSLLANNEKKQSNLKLINISKNALPVAIKHKQEDSVYESLGHNYNPNKKSNSKLIDLQSIKKEYVENSAIDNVYNKIKNRCENNESYLIFENFVVEVEKRKGNQIGEREKKDFFEKSELLKLFLQQEKKLKALKDNLNTNEKVSSLVSTRSKKEKLLLLMNTSTSIFRINVEVNNKKQSNNNIKYGNSTLDWEINLRKTNENKKENGNFKIGNAYPIYATIVKDNEEKEVIRKPGFIDHFQTIGSSINNTSSSLNEYLSPKIKRGGILEGRSCNKNSNLLINLRKTPQSKLKENERISNFYKTTNSLWSKIKNTSRQLNGNTLDVSILEKEENLNMLCLKGKSLLDYEKEIADKLTGKKYFVNMYMSSQFVKDRCIEEVFKYDY